MKLFELLQERGYIYQCTDLDEVQNRLNGDTPITFYLGIDPTADSLHIGHFFALMMFRYLQDAGHKGILVIGGATALIGDPSGKSDMRKMLTKEQVQYNLEEVKNLAKRFVKTDGDNPAIILNNAEWFNGYDYVDFMREIGVHFNINKMLAADAYANRLQEGGLTFLEMGYMLMQAYDFIYLNAKYGCTLQIGGSDQWGNIVAGTTLNRKKRFLSEDKKEEGDIYGLTCPLLLTKEGKKMRKTESGTLWVARDKTTPFDFYQYFYNVDDADVEMLLKLFTRVDLDTITQLCSTNIIEAKRVMAYEITKLVHGEKEAEEVLLSVGSLFGKQSNGGENAPESEYIISESEIPVVDLLVNAQLVSSKSEARRLIQQNGISIDGEKCKTVDDILKLEEKKGYVLIQKGKKVFMKVNICIK